MGENLPEALTSYEKPDWPELMRSGNFSEKRHALAALANHSRDAKMYAEGCVREIAEAAAGASVLETVQHVETLLGPLQEELGYAVSLLRDARENVCEPSEFNPDPTNRYVRLLNQTLKAEKGIRDMLGSVRDMASEKVTVNIDKQLNYADLRTGAGAEKPIPASFVDDFEEKV